MYWIAKCLLHNCLWFLLHLIIHDLRNSQVCWKVCMTVWLYAESFGLHYSECMPKQKWIGCSKLWFTKCRIHICLWFLLRLILHKLRNSGVYWKLCGTAWLYVESCGLHWSVCMSKQMWVGCAKHWFAKCRIHICLWFLFCLFIHKLRNSGCAESYVGLPDCILRAVAITDLYVSPNRSGWVVQSIGLQSACSTFVSGFSCI